MSLQTNPAFYFLPKLGTDLNLQPQKSIVEGKIPLSRGFLSAWIPVGNCSITPPEGPGRNNSQGRHRKPKKSGILIRRRRAISGQQPVIGPEGAKGAVNGEGVNGEEVKGDTGKR